MVVSKLLHFLVLGGFLKTGWRDFRTASTASWPCPLSMSGVCQASLLQPVSAPLRARQQPSRSAQSSPNSLLMPPGLCLHWSYSLERLFSLLRHQPPSCFLLGLPHSSALLGLFQDPPPRAGDLLLAQYSLSPLRKRYFLDIS